MTRGFFLIGVALCVAPFGWAQPGTSRRVFATASVAPSPSGAGGRGIFRLETGGGFSATNATLRELIEYAYQRHPFDHREVVGGPAWIGVERFDVKARGPRDHSPQADGSVRETWAMLRSLLAERFKLKVREEKKAVPVYALTLAAADALGPKLRRTLIDCGAIMRGQGPPLRPGQAPPCSMKTPPGRLFANTIRMATLAALLSRHVDRIVVDETGLSGRFDVELESSDIKPAPDYRPGPSDLALPPPAGPPIFVAVREHLGLTLEPKNGAIPVLVIEHAERPVRE